MRLNHYIHRLLWCAFLVLLLSSVPVGAEQVSSGALAGLGGIGQLTLGKADAMEWNPAALGGTKYTFQFLVTPISGRINTDDLTVDNVYRLLQGPCTPEQRARILATIQDNQFDGLGELSGGAYVSIGTNSLGASVRAFAQVASTPDMLSLLLGGNQTGRVYQVAGATATTVVYGDMRLGSVYSDPWLAKVLRIRGFHMGGTLRYLQGLQYSQTTVTGSTLEVIETDGTYSQVGDSRFNVRQSTDGKGVGTDLGVLLQLTPTLAVDASLVNLGRLWWENAQETTYDYVVDTQTGSGGFTPVSQVPVKATPIWDLPLQLRAGVNFHSDKDVVWSFRYSRQLRGQGAGAQEFVAATQLERLAVLPLRFAAKYSTADERLTFALGCGIRLGPLLLDVGTPNLTGLIAGGKDASVSVSTGLRF